MAMATETERESEPIPSVKDLASSDPAARRKNLQLILSHLETRSPSHYLTHTQALQLWRGFHVSLYMHDSKNQLSVQTLIATLSSTFSIIRQKDIELQSQSLDVSSQNGTGNTAVTSNGTPKKGQSEAKDIDDDEFAGFDDDEDESTPVTVQASNSWLSTYASAFWETMAREWSSVDQWRMNKYLLLIRFALRKILEISLAAHFGLEKRDDTSVEEENQSHISSKKRKAIDHESDKSTGKKSAKKAKNNTITDAKSTQPNPSSSLRSKYYSPDPATTTSQLAILSLSPLSPRERKVSDGLRLHMLDIYLDELFTAVKSAFAVQDTEVSQEEVKKVLGELFLEPIRGVAKDGLAKHVRVKAKEVLAESESRITELEI